MRNREFMNIIPQSLILGAAAAVSALFWTAATADTVVASWNTLHLGWGSEKDIGSVARLAAAFDLIALQEVMSVDELEGLEEEVEQTTGEPWSTLVSEAIGRGEYREHYAFLWRESQVSWLDGAVVYLDDRDAFSREPMSARFETADGYRFILASVHLIYGDTVERRELEVSALAGYRSWLTESFPDTPVYIAGDFNLPPDNSVWSDLGAVSSPLITTGATTLSGRDGRFVNLYDNIWAPAGIPIPVADAQILDFPKALGIDHETARATISDHAPVHMSFDLGMLWVTLPPHSASADAGAASPRGTATDARPDPWQQEFDDLSPAGLPELRSGLRP